MFLLKAKSYNLKATQGQALVESIVAMSVLTVGFLGLLALLARSLSAERVVADNYIATYLAAEGIEVTKNIIDANILQRLPWNAGMSDGDYEVDYASRSLMSYSARALSFDPVARLYSYHGSVPTPYVRKVSVALVGPDEMQINSKVMWTTRGGGSSEINLEDHFYNWRP